MRILVALLCLLPAVLCEEATCGGTYRGFQYTISSPHYPRDYPNSINCVYRLEGDTTAKCEQQFHLQFLDFYLKAADNCKGDYLQVGDRHIFCGNTVGLRKFSGKNNTLNVIFHSDGCENAKGFKILVTAVPCSLKLDPLKNRFYEGIAEDGRFVLSANDIRNGAYRRGIREDDGNVTTRLTLLPQELESASSVTPWLAEQQESSTPRAQIDLTLDGNTRINSLTPPLPTQPSRWNVSRDKPQITSYLFLPPKNNESAPGGSAQPIKDKAFDIATVPTNKLLPPIKNPVTFSKVQVPENSVPQAARDKSSNPSRKFAVIPARNYGEPGVGVVDYDLQVSSNDCDRNVPIHSLGDGGSDSSERINYELIQDQRFPGIGLGGSTNLVYDPRYGFISSSNNYPGSSYNPGGYYPGSYSNGNGYPGNNFNPSIGYPNGGYNPSIGYPGGNYNPSIGLPNYPTGGFNPSVSYPSYPNGGYNPSEIYPNYPNLGSGYNPGYNPNYPNLGSGYNPGYNPGLNPINPNYNPGYVLGYNPGYNPSIGGSYPSSGWNNGWTIEQTGECCRVQSGRRFSIVSPGFPGAVSTNTYSCRYTITKSSPDVCRLRINFKYFNFGADDQYCSYGYVEIDGRRFCGCKTGESTQVLFADYIAKSIIVTYSGYPRNRFGGFLIDIIQESCGNSGSYPSYPLYPGSPSYPQNPSYPYDPNNPIYPGYQRRRDVGNSTIKQQNTQHSVIFPSPVDPNPHIREKRNSGYSYPKPNIPFPTKDVQLTLDITGGKSHERFFGGSCQNRIFLDWAIASKEAILRRLRCVAYGIPRSNARISYLPPNSDENNSVSSCEEVNVNQGALTSPLYPNNYPHNLKKCYRFNKASGFCKLELHIKDFELETSQDCSKDYFSFSGDNKRYCGRSLNNYRTVFDLTRANSVEVYFTSDSHGTGRGFNIGFAQLPCEVEASLKRVSQLGVSA